MHVNTKSAAFVIVLVVAAAGGLFWVQSRYAPAPAPSPAPTPAVSQPPASLGAAMLKVPNPDRVAWGTQVTADGTYVVVTAELPVHDPNYEGDLPLVYVGYTVNLTNGTVVKSFSKQMANFFEPKFSLISDAPQGFYGVELVQEWEGTYVTNYYIETKTGKLLAALGWMGDLGGGAELTVDGESYDITYDPADGCDSGKPGDKQTVKGFLIEDQSVPFLNPHVIDCDYTEIVGSFYPPFGSVRVQDLGADGLAAVVYASDFGWGLFIPLSPFDASKAKIVTDI